MARKRSSRALVYGILPPDALANNVVGRYVSEGRTKLSAWSREYSNSVRTYLGDERKQEQVKKLLGGWYNIFLSEVYPSLTELYGKAKASYHARKKTMLTAGVVPPPG